MTCGVFPIDFCDIGLPMKGGFSVGTFEGTAEIDTDKSVVAITMIGSDGKFHTYAVPFRQSALSGDDLTIKQIAVEIEKTYKPNIDDAWNDWFFSRAEQDWDRLEAAE